MLQFLAEWLTKRYGFAAEAIDPEEYAPARFRARLEAGEHSFEVEAGVLYGDLMSPAFAARLRMIEREAGQGLKGSFALWVPPGVELPTDPEPLQPLLATLQRLAGEMQPGEIRDLPIPATLNLRKTGPDGAYITVVGGLSGYWSQMSQLIQGVYQLDTRAVHRLPRDPEFVEQLSRRIADASAGMSIGEWAEVESADHWTLQRLGEARGLTVFAAPPGFDPADGTFVRRTLRRLVREMGGRLAATEADLRILLLVTAMSSIRDENIGPALVGFDPALFAPIDLLCLVADGEIKAILEPPAGAVPWLRAGEASR